jgi:DNA-directed RNA polymerase subunit RPC12/RpoP
LPIKAESRSTAREEWDRDDVVTCKCSGKVLIKVLGKVEGLHERWVTRTASSKEAGS